MVEDWDKDDATKDPKTYLTEEGSLKAIYHMMQKYRKIKGIKINPTLEQQSPKNLTTSLMNTIFYDKEFHKFVLEKYGLVIHYDEKNNKFHIKNN